VTWSVLFHDEFFVEFSRLAADLQDELLAHAKLLAEFGPNLGRPTVDGLKGSRHPNMKELRFNWEGGADQRRFYRRMLAVADARLDDHLATLTVARRKETRHGKKTR
jgi:hypothetical protein